MTVRNHQNQSTPKRSKRTSNWNRYPCYLFHEDFQIVFRFGDVRPSSGWIWNLSQRPICFLWFKHQVAPEPPEGLIGWISHLERLKPPTGPTVTEKVKGKYWSYVMSCGALFLFQMRRLIHIYVYVHMNINIYIYIWCYMYIYDIVYTHMYIQIICTYYIYIYICY